MYNHNLKAVTASQNSLPFICRLVPFVGKSNSVIKPIICQKKPFVRNSGLTLVELITVLTIVGVLAAMAAPGMQRFVSSNRLTAQVNDLLADINLARSEAIKRNTTTGICVTAAGGGACLGGGNWVNGWLVYYVCQAGDPSGCVVDSNVTVKMHEVLTGTNTLTGPADALVYAKSGVLNSGAGQFTLTDPSIANTSGRRIVCVTATGRPNLSQVICP